MNILTMIKAWQFISIAFVMDDSHGLSLPISVYLDLDITKEEPFQNQQPLHYSELLLYLRGTYFSQ